MTTDLFAFDDSPLFDPFSPFNELSDTIDTVLHSSPQKTSHENEFDEFASLLFNPPPSPPNEQIRQLSLSKNPLLESALNSVDSESNPCLGVKTEKSFTQFCPGFGYVPTFAPNGNYGRVEKGVKKTFNNPCIDGQRPSLLFQSHFNSSVESPNVYGQRRACTTGDIQSTLSTPVATDRSIMQKPNPTKVVKYNAQQRKESIQRYKAKRPHRNFNKTIQYACRKVLADSRPRKHGRFACHDEAEGAETCNRHENKDDLMMDEGSSHEGKGGGGLFNSYAPTLFPYN